MPRDAIFELKGEVLTLTSERAIWWERTETLLVADLHWGKADLFRAASVPVPTGSTEDDLLRLERLVHRLGAKRLVILGDLLHGRASKSSQMLQAAAEWRERLADLEITLVRGNHDVAAGNVPVSWRMTVVEAPWRMGPFLLCHHPDRCDDGYVLAGHLHPAVVLTGPGGAREKLACFWFGAELGVLPAFGRFTGNAVVSPGADDDLFVVGDGQVLRVPCAVAARRLSNRRIPRR